MSVNPDDPRLPPDYREALRAHILDPGPVPIEVFLKARDAQAWLDYAVECVTKRERRA